MRKESMNTISKRATVSGLTLLASAVALVIPLHASETAEGSAALLLAADDSHSGMSHPGTSSSGTSSPGASSSGATGSGTSSSGMSSPGSSTSGSSSPGTSSSGMTGSGTSSSDMSSPGTTGSGTSSSGMSSQSTTGSGTSSSGASSSESGTTTSKSSLPVEDAQRPGATASRPGAVNASRLVSSYEQLKTGDAMRGGAIIGKKVVSSNGDELGKVTDIAVSPDGKISNVVVSVGGVMGAGDNLVILPWDALEVSPSNDQIKTSITKTELSQAPQFDKLSDRGLQFEMKDGKSDSKPLN